MLPQRVVPPLIVRSGAIDARAKAQELFVEVPRAVSSERAGSRDTVASPMLQARGDEHDAGPNIAAVSPTRETEHPFTGIAEGAFIDALNQYLEAAPKSQSEKDQYRYVNLETWKLVQGDSCLQTGQIAPRSGKTPKSTVVTSTTPTTCSAKSSGGQRAALMERSRPS